MAILDKLLELGGKLGVIRIVSTTASAKPGKIPTRQITLKELATEVSADELRRLTEMPAEMTVDFERVFETAGIKPPVSGWGVDKLRQALSAVEGRAEGVAGQDRKAVQQRLLAMLLADNAHVSEVLTDGVARDQALDAFEAFARKKMARRAEELGRRLAQLEAQIQALQEQRAQMRQEAENERAAWQAWHDRKVQYEKDMAAAMSFLLDQAVITVDEDGP